MISPPTWIKPELAALVKAAPEGTDWLHEMKLDGYRMHSRLDAGRVQILTRRGNDWTQKYPSVARDIAILPARNAYLDGELCGVGPDGRTAFNLIQNSIRFNDHQIGHGPAVHKVACEHRLEGIVSKRVNSRYEPDRRSWLKIKCLNREEFVVVGWSDPEGTRHRIGALLLGYFTPDGKLIYAGRVGTGMPVAELERLYGRLEPLAIPKMPLAEPPPRGGRFGSPLVLSQVHWVRPEMVVEVSYVEWTPDGLLRHVVFLGEREDKLAIDVRRERP
jgi:ATP-dependent DNA ligase